MNGMAEQLQADTASLDDFGTRLDVARVDFSVATNGAASFPAGSNTQNPSVDAGLADFASKSGRSLNIIDSYFTALAKMCHVSAEILRQQDAALAKKVQP
jgi:hypothetical protein